MLEPNDPSASWADIFAGVPPRAQLLERLTPAERAVALQVRAGLSNREIAQHLGKSEGTVKQQVSACLKKCGVRNRLHLILQLGLADAGTETQVL